MNYKKLVLSFIKALTVASLAICMALGPIWLQVIVCLAITTGLFYFIK